MMFDASHKAGPVEKTLHTGKPVPRLMLVLAVILLSGLPGYGTWSGKYIAGATTAPEACEAIYQQFLIGFQGSGDVLLFEGVSYIFNLANSGSSIAICDMTLEADGTSYPFSQALSSNCTGSGVVYDYNSPTGCSPANGLQSPKLLGSCSCKYGDNKGPTSPAAGDPIDIATGNVFYETTDYSTAGANRLRFTRYYNSRGNFTGMLGTGWHNNYESTILIESSTTVVAQRADGRMFAFNLTGGTWTPDTDVDYTLTASGDPATPGTTWALTGPDDTVEAYTTNSNASAPQAVLNSITLRGGYAQTLSYNSATGLLSKVADSYGRSLGFTFNSGNQLTGILTPDGTTIGYGYNGTDITAQLSSVSFETSPVSEVKYSYSAGAVAPFQLPGMLTGITDEDGNSYQAWTYDALARGLTNYQGGSAIKANLTTVTYDDADGSRTVTNALGVTDTYTFATFQGVTKVTGISRAATSTTPAATKSFSYDSNGYLASMTDWNGNLTKYTNNAHGLPTQVEEAYGSAVARTTTITYDATWVHLPHSITTPGLTVTASYDGSGELLARTYSDTTTTTSPYSTHGQTRTWTYGWSRYLLASVKTPRNFTTTLAYDTSGALTSVTDALGHATRVTSHTGGGLPLTVVDPNNVTTTLTYSPRQWLLSSSVATSAGARTTSYLYDAAGNRLRTTLPDGSYIAITFDAAHRIIKNTDALGNYVTYTLNALGDETAISAFTGSGAVSWKHSGSFDALGRLLVDTAGAGQATTYGYDKDGNGLTIKDGLGHITTRIFDALNRLDQSTDANAGVVIYAYNAHDRPTSVTDPNGHVTSWVRDGFDEAIGQTSPDSGASLYHFDGDGNLTQKVDAAGIITNHTFDALDRLLTTAYPADTAENVAYGYDQAGHGFGVGRLTGVTDAVGALSRSYDERGNRLAETRTAGTKTYTTSYGYTPASLVASVTYPSGSLASYTRDAMGRITAVAVKAPSASAVTLASTITYAPFGPVTGVKAFNGDAEAFTFDADYRMTKLVTTAANGPQNFTYGYDAANNVKTITDAVCTSCSATYGYDAINRLTSAASWYGSYAYTLDKNGNFLTNNEDLTPATYSYQAGSNRISSITVGGTAYPVTTNAEGNITGFTRIPGNATTLTYNKANRLATSATPSQAASYAYDGLGQRFSKTDAGSPATLYFHDLAGNLIEEVDNGIANDYVMLDGRPVGTFTPSTNTLAFLHGDQNGSPLTATDKNARVSWMVRYLPYGGTSTASAQSGAAAITQSNRFPGQVFDPETLLNHNGWRDLAPSLGRYVEADPIGLGGGLNAYTYVVGNPINRIDPKGLEVIFLGDLPPWMEIIGRVGRILGPTEEEPVAPVNYPKPPGWTSQWRWGCPEGKSQGEPRWFDPKGGEWRWHEDPDHTGHWDYNSWGNWNSPWQNLDPGGNPTNPVIPRIPVLVPPTSPPSHREIASNWHYLFAITNKQIDDPLS